MLFTPGLYQKKAGVFYPLFKGFLGLLPKFAVFYKKREKNYEQFAIIKKSTEKT